MNVVGGIVLVLLCIGVVGKCVDSGSSKTAQLPPHRITPQVRYEPVYVPVPEPTYAPAPQQQQRPLLVCPQCAGRGQVRASAYSAKECDYCKGMGTVEAGRGRRGGYGGY